MRVQIGSQVWITEGVFQGRKATVTSLANDAATVMISIFDCESLLELTPSQLRIEPVAVPVPKHFRMRAHAIESYNFDYHTPGFLQERFAVRLDRFKSFCKVVSSPMQQDEQGRWFCEHAEENRVSQDDWSTFSHCLLECDFWKLPESNACAGMDGEWYVLEGVRNNQEYHRVRRWLGGEIGKACDVLARLAGIR